MTQVLEFFLNNYILFLVGAIIILLAVVGYYADKTNFGQEKNSDNKDDEAPKIDINNLGLMDASQKLTNSVNNTVTDNNNLNLKTDLKIGLQENMPTIDNQTSGIKNVADDIMSIEMPAINNEKLAMDKNNKDIIKNNVSEGNLTSSPNNAIASVISKEFGKLRNDIILNVAKQQEESQKEKQKEEEFKKFNDEFNSVLPKMELMNSDLINEIDDLELGKTQKLNLNDLTKLDDINLPRINNSITDDHEIWKF